MADHRFHCLGVRPEHDFDPALRLGLAWLLARHEWPGKSLVETFVSLPLVMPPVATGLILLNLFGRSGCAGRLAAPRTFPGHHFHLARGAAGPGSDVFSLAGALGRVAFEEVNPRLEQIACTLGASHWRVFYSITLPLALRGIIGGMLLAFARALGEFGATIMVAGNIPGKTSTLSLAIFEHVQLGEDADAYRLLGVSVALAFVAVWSSEYFLRRKRHWQ